LIVGEGLCPPTEFPAMYLDGGVSVLGQNGTSFVWIRRDYQYRSAHPRRAIVGQQRPVCDQIVLASGHCEVSGRSSAQAEHKVSVATRRASGKVPHGTSQRVAPPPQQHVPVQPA